MATPVCEGLQTPLPPPVLLFSVLVFFLAFLISHFFPFLNSYYFPLQSRVFSSLIWTFVISVVLFSFLIWMYIHSCHVQILLYIISSVRCEVVPICLTLWGKRMFLVVTCSCTRKKACCELRKRWTCLIGHRLSYSSWILLAAFLCPPFPTSVSACKHSVRVRAKCVLGFLLKYRMTMEMWVTDWVTLGTTAQKVLDLSFFILIFLFFPSIFFLFVPLLAHVYN